jgi:hypothetical protein
LAASITFATCYAHLANINANINAKATLGAGPTQPGDVRPVPLHRARTIDPFLT